MIEQLKAMLLEDMAESARAIVEDEQHGDDFNNNAPASGAQSRIQHLKKLRIKSTMPRDKRYQVLKVNAFKKAISEFGK